MDAGEKVTEEFLLDNIHPAVNNGNNAPPSNQLAFAKPRAPGGNRRITKPV